MPLETTSNRYASELFLRIDGEKQTQILSAAVELFASCGYDNASVNRIAASADISVGALYKYFASKNDLFMYIVEVAAERMTGYINGILESGIRFMSKVEKLLRLSQKYSREDSSLIRLYNVFTADNDAERAALIAGKFEGITARAYNTLIRSVQDSGELRRDIDTGILAFMMDNQFMIMQFSFACRYYEKRFALYVGERNAADDEYVIKSIVKIIADMFGADRSESKDG